MDGGFGRDAMFGDEGDDTTCAATTPATSSTAGPGTTAWTAASAEDRLEGGDGNDFIIGGTGPRLHLGRHRATTSSTQSSRPASLSEGIVDCGPGNDTVYVDRRDVRAKKVRRLREPW